MPHLHNDTQVRIYAFTGAACAVIAVSDAVPAELKVVAGAVAAGCSATLALMRQTGHPPPRTP